MIPSGEEIIVPELPTAIKFSSEELVVVSDVEVSSLEDVVSVLVLELSSELAHETILSNKNNTVEIFKIFFIYYRY